MISHNSVRCRESVFGLGKASTNHLANIIVKRGGVVKLIDTSIARSIEHVIVVTEIAGRIAL
jgi:hypothetical protein